MWLDALVNPFPVAVSSQCDFKHVAVVLGEMYVEAVGDKAGQIGEIFPILCRKNNRRNASSFRLRKQPDGQINIQLGKVQKGKQAMPE